MSIYETLIHYKNSNMYPMHMPGHKRNKEFSMCNPYAIDVTEVEGTDNLHHPREMIRELMNQMKEIYRTEESYVLVNGSTCGILAAVSACCHRGDVIIMDRNCHRSVYHAVYLLDLQPVYLYPEQDAVTGIPLGIRPEQVREALEENPATCVIVTSPTYEGIVSEIEELAREVHRKEIPLIVDEAHGAHFAWDDRMPTAAMVQGADLVIESLHKTLPAFTQTGVLHLCSRRVKKEMIERYLGIYETSSPSYILMAGVDRCMDWMLKHGRQAFDSYADNLKLFEKKAAGWKTLVLWQHPKKEPSKLVILTGTRKLTGQQLADILRKKYAIEVEMEAPGYVLAMTSICDSEEGFLRLADALSEIDAGLGENVSEENERTERAIPYNQIACKRETFQPDRPRRRMGIYEAMNQPYQEVPVEKSIGKISAEYAFLYPPGIPFLVPGEEITEETVCRMQEAWEKKRMLLGPAAGEERQIRVVAQ